jgi:hypothetical protein
MAVFNGMFPILAGKEDGGRTFAAACMGERRKGFEAQAARTGLARETWALQETPMGSFMLVWFEAPDIEKGVHRARHLQRRVLHLVSWPSQGCDWRRLRRSTRKPATRRAGRLDLLTTPRKHSCRNGSWPSGPE